MNQPTNVISIQGHQFTQNELKILREMQHKLMHGTNHEKQVIRELVNAFQLTNNGPSNPGEELSL